MTSIFSIIGFEIPVGHPGRDVHWQLNMWVWNSGGRGLG